MILNYIRTAFRSLQKNKGFTALNIVGLSVGLTAFLLIVLYVTDELGYDRFNKNANRIFRITLEAGLNGHEGVYATSEAPLQKALQQNFPEIEQTTRLIDKDGLPVSPHRFFFRKETENIEETKVVFSESSLFSLFTLPMIYGQPAGSLDAPHTAVITESTAKKYFNKTDVVGQTLILNDTSLYKITGVIKDIPRQSHFRYDFFLSFSTLPECHLDGWGYSGMHNYVLLRPNADIHKLEKEIRDIEVKNSPANPTVWTTGSNYFRTLLTPLLKLHLNSGAEYELEPSGSMSYIYIFSAIAIFILLVACINFMNLSTAQSANRAREVGIRKVLGSARKDLIARYLAESMILSLCATILACVMTVLFLPVFESISGKELSFTPQILLWLVPFLILLVIVIGVLAGSYPAFFLSSFQPIEVLKGKLSRGFKDSNIRSGLVVFQFAVSIFLIIGTLVIYSQLNYIRNRSLGFNRDHLLIIKNTTSLGEQASVLNQELKQLPGVVSGTMTAYLPTGTDRMKTGLFPDREIDVKKDMLTEFWQVDQNYLRTMDIRLVQGRNFATDMATDSSALIVNESFLKKYNVKDPLGKTLYRLSYGLQGYHIVGVIKDFNFESLKNEISPLALAFEPNNGAIALKVQSAGLTGLMSAIELKWKGISPRQKFDYSFADADFDSTYRSEDRAGTLFISFSVLAIVISCLGLFGLAAFAAEQRSKEIGIRKVLGASIPGIIRMLSGDFLKLVCISLLIAAPLGWLLMGKWLESFSYRTSIHWWIFAAAGIAAVLIAFGTISFQSLKAARMNPAKSLKSE